jgi:diguanylate cyclase (GGDEF)-like protein
MMRSRTGQAASAPAYLIMTLYVVLLGSLYVASVVDETRFAGERIGIVYSLEDQGILLHAVEARLPAGQAGLQAGDLIVSAAGMPIRDMAAFDAAVALAASQDHVLPLVIEREDRQLSIEIRPGTNLNLSGLIAQFVLVCAYLGLTLLGARYSHEDRRARLLTLFVGLIGIEMALPLPYSFSDSVFLAIALFWPLATGAQIALELHLVSLIPNRLPLLRRHRWLVPGFYLLGGFIALILSAVVLDEWYGWTPDGDRWWAGADRWIMAFWGLAVALILVAQIVRTSAIRERQQAGIVLLGLLPWLAYIAIQLLWPYSVLWDTGWAALAEDLVLLVFPVAVFLAIFRYGLFSVEGLLRRSLIYGIAAGLIILLLYGLLTAALPWITARVGNPESLWLTTGLAVILGVLFRPLRKGVGHLVERGLYPERWALRQRLVGITSDLSGESNVDRLMDRMIKTLRGDLRLVWAAAVIQQDRLDSGIRIHADGLKTGRQEALLDHFAPGGELYEHIVSRNRPSTMAELSRRLSALSTGPERLGADVLLPLRTHDRAIGILLLSSRQNGSLFTAEDLELLDLFSRQIATRLDNLRLFQNATYEGLTGLLRREAILEELGEQCARHLEHQTRLSVVMLDLDHFKTINDTHGHLFGDQILEKVAGMMQTRKRASDALGRFGGEEFLMVLPETTAEGARKVAKDMIEAVHRLRIPTPDPNATISLSASAGVASTAGSGHADPAELARDLLDRADQALYRAKQQGRNRVEVAA